MISQSYQACKPRCIFHSLISHQTMTIYDYDYMNFIVSVLNWAIKVKSKETYYAVNYWIYYSNEREKPNRRCHKPAWKCFYSFYFSVKNGRWDTITVPRSVSTHINCWLLLILIWKSYKKSNGVSAEKIQRFAMA